MYNYLLQLQIHKSQSYRNFKINSSIKLSTINKRLLLNRQSIQNNR